MTSHVPAGCNTVNTYLIVPSAREAIDYYVKVFGAKEGWTLPSPTGSICHAEVVIGCSTVMLAEADESMGFKSPEQLGGSPVSMCVYFEDADSVFKKAVEEGATVACEMMDAFWGDRFGKIVDPFGHHWGIATHKEDLTPEQLQKGAEEWFAEMAKQGGECSSG
ncbi:MAG: VOC family protein [Pirellulaceae bacterium]|nr:VOC family protein [Pirellulaceae bacterium]